MADTRTSLIYRPRHWRISHGHLAHFCIRIRTSLQIDREANASATIHGGRQVTSSEVRPRSRFVGVNGLRLHYQEWSDRGPPLIFLHRVTSSCETWKLIAPGSPPTTGCWPSTCAAMGNRISRTLDTPAAPDPPGLQAALRSRSSVANYVICSPIRACTDVATHVTNRTEVTDLIK